MAAPSQSNMAEAKAAMVRRAQIGNLGARADLLQRHADEYEGVHGKGSFKKDRPDAHQLLKNIMAQKLALAAQQAAAPAGEPGPGAPGMQAGPPGGAPMGQI